MWKYLGTRKDELVNKDENPEVWALTTEALKDFFPLKADVRDTIY